MKFTVLNPHANLLEQQSNAIYRAFASVEAQRKAKFKELLEKMEAESRNQIEVRAVRSVMNNVVSDTAKLLSAMRNRS